MALAFCRPRNPLANVRRRFRPELLALEDRLVPAQLTWQGDIAGNSNWNAGVIGTNTNWSGNVIPQDGDTLVFAQAGSKISNNNIAGLELAAIHIFDGGYNITGNSIGLSGDLLGAIPAGAGTSTFAPNIQLTVGTGQEFRNNGAHAVILNGTIDLNGFDLTIEGTNGFQVAGAITSTGDVTKNGDGTVEFTGTANKNFSGVMRIRDGVLIVNSNTSSAGISTNIIVGDDGEGANTAVLRLASQEEVPNTATITVLGDGLLDKTSSSEVFGQLILGSTSGGGNVTIASGASLAVANDAVTVRAAPTFATIGGAGTFFLTDPTTITVDLTTELHISAQLSGSSNAGVVKVGRGGLVLANSANDYPGITEIAQGYLTLGADDAVPQASQLLVHPGALFDLSGFSQTLPGLAGSGEVTSTSATPATLTIEIPATNFFSLDSEFAGNLTGNLALTMTAAPANNVGSLTLGGFGGNTYTGPTRIQSGRLILDKPFVNQALPNGDAVVDIILGTGGLGLTFLELQQDFQIDPDAGILIGSNGRFDLNGHDVVAGSITVIGGSLDNLADAGPAHPALSQTLTVRSFAAQDGFWNVAINGAVPGLAHDQLVVSELVEIDNLDLNLRLGFTADFGDSFTILDFQAPGQAINGTFRDLPEGSLFTATGQLFRITYTGGDGNDVVVTRLPGPNIVVAAPDAGFPPRVRVFDSLSGREFLNFLAYPARFTGGVRVATGDVNGDGAADIITAPGPGLAAGVRVFDGLTGKRLPGVFGAGIKPFGAAFRQGFNVAATDFNLDNRADIIVAPSTGFRPVVKIISGADGRTVLANLKNVFPNSGTFRRGVRVAAGQLDNFSEPDLVVQSGFGAQALVKVLGGADFQPLPGALGAGFNPFADIPAVNAALSIAVGDVAGEKEDDIVVSAERGSRLVRVFNDTGEFQTEFVGHEDARYPGLRVAVTQAFREQSRVIVGTTKARRRKPELRIVDAESAAVIDAFFAFEKTGLGMFVAGT